MTGGKPGVRGNSGAQTVEMLGDARESMYIFPVFPVVGRNIFDSGRNRSVAEVPT